MRCAISISVPPPPPSPAGPTSHPHPPHRRQSPPPPPLPCLQAPACILAITVLENTTSVDHIVKIQVGVTSVISVTG